MIKIIKAQSDKDYQWIYNVMCNEKDISNIFRDRYDRLAGSFLNFIIYRDNTKVGFLNLVDENVPGYIFLDAGILPKFRGQGYIKEAIKLLLKSLSNISHVLIAETKKDNTSAINSIINNGGIEIGESKTSIFYTFEYEKFQSKPQEEQNILFDFINKKQR